jgi:hypothetical protein
MLRTIAVVLCALTLQAQTALKTLNGPQGGKIIYGQVPGETNEAGAMAAVLRMLHRQYGARPQVGKLFAAKGTQSVAAFFSVARTTGMIIAVKATTDHVEAAAVYDDSARFESTRPAMMKTLMSVWHPLAAAEAAGPAGGGASAPLRKTCTNDRTACMDLPDGWQVSPQSAGGSMIANGPNGEMAFLGFTILASDLNNPRARQTYQTVQRGGLRGTSYANGIYIQLVPDLGRDFVQLLQMFRAKNNLSQANFQLSSVRPVQGPPGNHCALIAGQVDGGKGPAELNSAFCIGPEGPASGGFLAITDYTLVPQNVAARERATVAAIFGSFYVDHAAVQRMANAIAAPEIERIHAIGRAAAAQAKAAHEREEIHNSSVYQHWDDIDRRSKAFSDYTLGYTVLRDKDNTEHETLWNEDADELMRRFPGEFEVVTVPGYWKGTDY